MFTREQVLADFLREEFSLKAAQQGILYFMFDDCIRNGEYEGNMYILKKLNSFTYVVYAEWASPEKGQVDIANCHVFTKSELLSAMAKATGKSEEMLTTAGELWRNW